VDELCDHVVNAEVDPYLMRKRLKRLRFLVTSRGLFYWKKLVGDRNLGPFG
jgi:hypothetical protein